MKLVKSKEIQEIRGILFPAAPKYRQFVVTGPPGSGKSTLVERIKGWPNEGYLDLSVDGWWKAQHLTFRPREIHLGFPFTSVEGARSVFDDDWDETGIPDDLDLTRIKVPPERTWILQTDWRRRYAFEFLLPPAEVILERRTIRAEQGTHHVDTPKGLTLESIRRQLDVFMRTAKHFHSVGMIVHVRERIEDPPMEFVDGDGD